MQWSSQLSSDEHMVEAKRPFEFSYTFHLIICKCKLASKRPSTSLKGALLRMSDVTVIASSSSSFLRKLKMWNRICRVSSLWHHAQKMQIKTWRNLHYFYQPLKKRHLLNIQGTGYWMPQIKDFQYLWVSIILETDL